MTPTPFATMRPRLSGVLLRAKIPRKYPRGTSMTRPVGTRAIWRGATVTSADADRSNPADSAVAYVGRGTVASSRLIRICISAAYIRVAVVALLVTFALAATTAAQD